MKITEVRLGILSVPLRVPFKTALRSVSSVEDIIVEIHTDSGQVGYGEAPPTGAITGDTTGAIIGALKDHLIKTIVGRDVDDFEELIQAVDTNYENHPTLLALLRNEAPKLGNDEESTNELLERLLGMFCTASSTSFLSTSSLAEAAKKL